MNYAEVRVFHKNGACHIDRFKCGRRAKIHAQHKLMTLPDIKGVEVYEIKDGKEKKIYERYN